MAAPEAKGGKKAGRAKFHERAIAISQDKSENGTVAAVTAVIVGGGPAAMICGLALMNSGFRVIIIEEQALFSAETPAPGQDNGPTEPLLFSPETAYLLHEWGMSARDACDGASTPKMGPSARQIPFRDIRALGGRLLRREPSDCWAIRSQDFCAQIHAVLTLKSKENAIKVKSGHFDLTHKGSYTIHHGAKVLDLVDISWGVAVYLSNGTQLAGDFLIGADGTESLGTSKSDKKKAKHEKEKDRTTEQHRYREEQKVTNRDRQRQREREQEVQ